MIRKKKGWIALILAVMVIGISIVWIWWPTDKPITFEMYQNIRIGMTLAEVEDFFGVPGGSHDDFVIWAHDNHKISYQQGSAGTELVKEYPRIGIRFWYGGKGAIGVRFSPEGVSTDKQFLPLGESGTSFRQRLRSLLGL